MADTLFFSRINWSCLVVDEAQRIKNNNGMLYNKLKVLATRTRILLSGAPIQNTLDELYAMMSFIMPSVFEPQELFVSIFKDIDIRSHANTQDRMGAARCLQMIMKPFFLRRVKADVLKDLPKKSSYIVYAQMTDLQKNVYKGVLSKSLSGTANLEVSFNNVVMQLRKCSLHPYLFDGIEPEPFVEGDHLVNVSGKLSILDNLLNNLKTLGRRVLIFSTMSRMLDILQDYCTYRGHTYERIDGSVRGEERFEAINRFSDTQTFVFLLTTRAGGVGLNLVAADTVIFMDSDWNPTVDMQVCVL